MSFTRAIVRKPCRQIVRGLSSADLGPPDPELALIQHAGYVRALEACGLAVTVLEPDDDYPDSTFVEDAALLTRACAVITRPGVPSRRGETDSIRAALSGFYIEVEEIRAPGTVEGGDIMMVGDHFYIGLSVRTNLEGARQVIEILARHGLSGSTVSFGEMLHLKTGIAYLENDTIAATGAYLEIEEFKKFKRIKIDADEAYAANCLWVNGTVLAAAGYPKAAGKIAAAGYPIIEVEVSEFRKLDGGLSCLSLRF